MPQPENATDAEAPTIDVRWLPNSVAAHVVLAGQHDLSTAEQLDNTLTKTLEFCTHLIVDISTTTFIDSSTIRVLLSAKGRSDAADRQFHLLLGTAPIVERALEITGVLNTLNRTHTLNEALAGSFADDAHASLGPSS